jgi:transcriptional regulator with PAS, ATPase and Fis domain
MISKIFDTIRESLLLLDSSLTVSAASRNFYSKFLVSAEETIGQPLHNLGKGQWNIPELTNLISNIFTTNKTIENYQVEHTFPIIGHKIMLLNARKIFDEKDNINKVLLSIEDITQKEIIAREKIYYSELNKSIIDTIKDPLLVLDENLMVIEASRNYNNNFSIDREEIIGKFFYDIGNGQWDISELRELISDIMINNNSIESYQISYYWPQDSFIKHTYN